jgi:diguanylate cyclase (GGDEF)-like protein
MSKTNENTNRFTGLKSALEKSSLFRGIDFDAVEYLLSDCQVLHLQEGVVLLSKNQRNDNVYVIISGSFCINLIEPNDLAIASIGEGECLGEMSVIDGRDTSASVVAAADASVLQIPKDILWSMINVSHGMAQNLLYILSQRIRTDNKIMVENFYLRREIEKAAQSDPLTSLHNRRWFDDAFARQIKRCNQDGAPFCLMILDLDYFKRINDTYGHIAGDITLVAIARLLSCKLRPMDMLARYGGEEFALGLPDTNLDQSFAIAERLRLAIGSLTLPFRSGEPLPHLTVSIGIAQMQANQTLEAMYAVADAALYRAKDEGRNRVVI